ncbi:MAG: hypothetical protein LBC53_07685 [Spirochaetaceae bacterium]|jgi:hypothetical protein|nr:hypothetical protein [Spirochaetaceae bacterium]
MVQEKDIETLRNLLRNDKDLQQIYSEAFLHGLREDKSLDYAAIAKELFDVIKARKLPVSLESATDVEYLLTLQAKQIQERKEEKVARLATDSVVGVSRVTLYNEAAVVTALEIWRDNTVEGKKIYDSGNITVWKSGTIALSSKMQTGDLFVMAAAVRGSGKRQLSHQMKYDSSEHVNAYFTLSGDLCNGPHLKLEYKPDK